MLRKYVCRRPNSINCGFRAIQKNVCATRTIYQKIEIFDFCGMVGRFFTMVELKIKLASHREQSEKNEHRENRREKKNSICSRCYCKLTLISYFASIIFLPAVGQHHQHKNSNNVSAYSPRTQQMNKSECNTKTKRREGKKIGFHHSIKHQKLSQVIKKSPNERAKEEKEIEKRNLELQSRPENQRERDKESLRREILYIYLQCIALDRHRIASGATRYEV